MPEHDDRWLDLGAFIRDQRRVGQLSLRKLSEMAGISNPYLSQIERGLRKPSAEILRQIAQALHISAETLYVRAGILDEPDGEVDLVAEIGRDPWLDEEQKKTLVHIYESFRAERQAQADAHLVATGAVVDHPDDDPADPADPADPDDDPVDPDGDPASDGPEAAGPERQDPADPGADGPLTDASVDPAADDPEAGAAPARAGGEDGPAAGPDGAADPSVDHDRTHPEGDVAPDR